MTQLEGPPGGLFHLQTNSFEPVFEWIKHIFLA